MRYRCGALPGQQPDFSPREPGRRRKRPLGGRLALLALVACTGVMPARAVTFVVNNTADVIGSCPATCTLRTAITLVTAGSTITFDPAILPGVITLQSSLPVAGKAVTIEGPGAGLLAIDGNQTDRIFLVRSATLAVSGVTLSNGRTPIVDGVDRGAGTGQAGGRGSDAHGGCIDAAASSTLTLVAVTLRNCTAQGGDGGNGGSGVASTTKFGGLGGAGGDGGVAVGGAIYAEQSLVVLSQASIVDSRAIGGNGGVGGSGGEGTYVGNGGDGGAGGGAAGGALYIGFAGSVRALNLTAAESGAQGGKGGNGGSSDPDLDVPTSGDGGDGGNALGGLIALDNSNGSGAAFYFGFSTLAVGAVTAGAHGSTGRGAGRGEAGQDGSAAAPLLQMWSSSLPATLDKSVLFGAAGADQCGGPIAGFSSLSSSPTCGGAAVIDAWFKPLLPDAPAPGFLPRFNVPAIDSTTCGFQPSTQFPGPTNTVDMRGTARPQGDICDFGAIEADYIFVGGFP